MSELIDHPNPVDEAMLPLADFINEISDIGGEVSDEFDLSKMSITQAELDMPVQIDLNMMENDEIKLGMSPPLLYMETSFMPVFHQLRVTLVRTENEKINEQ